MKTTKKSQEIKHQILPKPFGGRKRPKKKKKKKRVETAIKICLNRINEKVIEK